MTERRPETGSHSLRGPIDRTALREFGDVFERLEPLATSTRDDAIDARTLRIELEDGIGAATNGRFDVRWSTVNDYNIHYRDDRGRNLRWDLHPHDFPTPDGDEHFHPPPDASSEPEAVAESCIAVSEITLVARAAVTVWRHAYESESVAGINEIDNPP